MYQYCIYLVIRYSYFLFHNNPNKRSAVGGQYKPVEVSSMKGNTTLLELSN